ncbi:hypothetical protein [Lentzea guizhouensis]|uniref:hypothetical protein n=1 Tax=Lentzea guizhouensis TaxID=1586287 RepID=UPI001C54C9B7|nr:hypothetical protein [Lentzea guizhouensis]
MARAIAGDQAAYGELVARYTALAHRTAYLLGAGANAGDVVQEARRQMPFEIHLPVQLGTPDQANVHEGRFVTLRYGDVRLDQFDGTVHEQPHGVGQTLIWQRGQVTLRLEGDLTEERALEISAS